MEPRSPLFLPGLVCSAAAMCACASTSQGSGQDAAPAVTVAPVETAASSAPAPTASAGGPASWNVTYETSYGGWSKSGPDGDTLLQLSGPPGGPLGFSVHRAPAMADDAAFGAWLKAHFKKMSGWDVNVGAPIKVSLGGAQVTAYAFIAGESMARTQYCHALWPVADPAKGSVVVSADVGASGKSPASCDFVTTDPSIAPVWKSLKVEPH